MLTHRQRHSDGSVAKHCCIRTYLAYVAPVETWLLAEHLGCVTCRVVVVATGIGLVAELLEENSATKTASQGARVEAALQIDLSKSVDNHENVARPNHAPIGHSDRGQRCARGESRLHALGLRSVTSDLVAAGRLGVGDAKRVVQFFGLEFQDLRCGRGCSKVGE